jgi:hypothetical protein
MRRAIYLDGPLKGLDHPVPDCMRYVEVVDPSIDASLQSATFTNNLVTYQFKKFGFTSGGQIFWVWIGWCGHYDEPSAETIVNGLLNPDAIMRGHYGSQGL